MDYKDTVFLPKTNFQMRANLPQLEPQILAKWMDSNLFEQMMKIRQGQPTFILHDGPPYANGPIHAGTAMNKILKDIVNRSYHLLGRQIIYVPGWDCHGLPIEWKVEEEYRKQKKDKREVSLLQFRKECGDSASGWIDVQKEQFKRLGVWAKWDAPYNTMQKLSEATIVREMSKFLLDGSLYRGDRPVMWSVVEQTALADAEVEYYDHTSPSLYVKFPIVKPGHGLFEGASAVIWTTTVWTLPSNRAIAYGHDVEYVLIAVEEVSAESLVTPGDKLIVAEALLEDFCKTTGIEQYNLIERFQGSMLANSICHHPLYDFGYTTESPLLPGEHVTTDSGTGLVHTAPAHGVEDFILGQKYGLEVTHNVQGDGLYIDSLPIFGGMHVFKVGPAILEQLQKVNCLLWNGEINHSYPCSWRSKAPLIYRTTPQWFISMEKTGLREKALRGIEEVTWIPAKGKRRIQSMIEERPDWCISRQRAWGVPLAIFMHKKTLEPLRDEEVQNRIADIFEKEGADVWFEGNKERFLGDKYNPNDYEQIKDIIEVWFESGCSHAYVLEARQDEGLKWPADLYLEGSDQHRGWFHTSLLESCGTRGRAPYKIVLTHGYVLDDKGRKMSKSLGNTLDPLDIADEMGVEMLRLWVASSDYSEDLRVAKERLKYQQDTYRRLRNTLRYLLGGLDNYADSEVLAYDELPELEKWVLHRVYELNQNMLTNLEKFDFQSWFSELHNFCAVDLSSFYFDIRKDVLYCDGLSSQTRIAMRYVFNQLFKCLTIWMSPVLCFTAEEAWQHRYGESESVHLQLFPDIPMEWKNDEVSAHYQKIRQYRKVMTGALEIARNERKLGSSLQGSLKIYDPQGEVPRNEKWDDISITSYVEIVHAEVPSDAFVLDEVPGIGVIVEMASGEKCQRCWKVLDEVGKVSAEHQLCQRCHDVVIDEDMPMQAAKV